MHVKLSGSDLILALIQHTYLCIKLDFRSAASRAPHLGSSLMNHVSSVNPEHGRCSGLIIINQARKV